MKKRYEIEKLIALKDKKSFELQNEFDRLQSSAGQYKVELNTKIKLLSQGEQQLEMVKRLSDNLIEDPITYLQGKIAQLQKGLSEERTRLLQNAALIQMQILAEG